MGLFLNDIDGFDGVLNREAKKLKSNWPVVFGGLEVFISPVVAIDDAAIGNHLAIGKSNPERLHEFAICQCGDSGHRTEHDFPF